MRALAAITEVRLFKFDFKLHYLNPERQLEIFRFDTGAHLHSIVRYKI